MPIYEYRCEVCDTEFERRQRFDDPPVAECPEGHGDVKRLISSAGIIFKGPGFYVTDNRNSRNGNGASKPKESEGTSETKSETTSESSTSTDSD